MKKLILLAGAAVLLSASPALADKGKNKSGMKSHSAAKVHTNARGYVDVNRNGVADWRERRMIDANANGIADWRERRTVDINRNGVADWRERWMDRNRDGIDDRQQAMMRRYGGQDCPPGLAKRNPRCVPPGQVGRNGSAVPADWKYMSYGDIPAGVRTRYDLDDDYRYVYRDRRLYVVDPATSLITRVINSIRF